MESIHCLHKDSQRTTCTSNQLCVHQVRGLTARSQPSCCTGATDPAPRLKRNPVRTRAALTAAEGERMSGPDRCRTDGIMRSTASASAGCVRSTRRTRTEMVLPSSQIRTTQRRRGCCWERASRRRVRTSL